MHCTVQVLFVQYSPSQFYTLYSPGNPCTVREKKSGLVWSGLDFLLFDWEVRGSLENLSVPTNDESPKNRVIQISFVEQGDLGKIWSLAIRAS